MLKDVLNLEGIQVLSKTQQKSINGGIRNCVGQIGSEHFIYQPGTTAGPNAGELVPVAMKCYFTCEKSFLGITTGHTTIEADC
ncbi:hypothetical protein [Flavobacterium kingsejongi]|uniref:Uncharacterized protein n=1 Tax=Flavobacterium kingsejongi TaxID=1678728 RepID=A0A2S1LLL8_9FLAO|nr:hypothetical protein [Flavobacterium kingsejongi]AWG24660.1 hypothetical protein FK004_05135 [Flavobacterium kingsejongi]